MTTWLKAYSGLLADAHRRRFSPRSEPRREDQSGYLFAGAATHGAGIEADLRQSARYCHLQQLSEEGADPFRADALWLGALQVRYLGFFAAVIRLGKSDLRIMPLTPFTLSTTWDTWKSVPALK